MTFTEAAAQVLRLVGKPLHYKEITDVAIEKDLLSHVGKSPDVTMGARLAALVKKGDKENPLVRVKPGVFALREWDKETIQKGLADRTPALQRLEERQANGDSEEELEAAEEVDDSTGEGSEPDSEEPSAPAHASPPELDDEDFGDIDDAERARAELAATASELFAAEEDDDEPILGGDDTDFEKDDLNGSGRRRRRRRRRRGGGGGGDDLPGYTVQDAPRADEGAAEVREGRERDGRDREPREGREREGRDREPREGRDREPREGRDREPREGRDREPREGRDREPREGRDREPREGRDRDARDRDRGPERPLDDLSGAALADALAGLIAPFEKQGGVAIRQIVDMARRKGRLSGDPQQVQASLTAAMRADNLRLVALDRRPRFRFNNGRVALTDWLLDSQGRRLEQDVFAAVERYREAARKNLAKRIQELPPKAIGDFVLVLLERLGVSALEVVRRQGSFGNEMHLSGKTQGPTVEVPTGIVVRRDGRDIGRERVSELRGSLHHYGPAVAGWIITTGQVLSGAREEAASPTAAPIRLFDGEKLARVCEEHGIGVVSTRVTLPMLDSELFESLRSG